MLKKFQLKGIHCEGCKILIEEEVKQLKGVIGIAVDHACGEASLEIDDKLFQVKEFERKIIELGYDLETEKSAKSENEISQPSFVKYFWLGLLLVIFVGVYFFMQRFGAFQLLARLNERDLSLGLIFAMGLLASFHCVGMCGSIVAAYTVKNQQHNGLERPSNFKIHWQYNSGRVLSYTVIGAILGGFGSFFGINPVFGGAMTILAGLFMILMGLSILANFRISTFIKLRTPDFIAKIIFGNKNSAKPRGPFIVGLLNGLMPCAPLQAMQLYALTAGGVFAGAGAMFAYGIGTVPLMFGFGSLISFLSGMRIRQIVKISGAIVIILGLMMINRGLVNFGYEIVITPSSNQAGTETELSDKDIQTVNMDVTYSGYQPNIIKIKKGVPVRWVIHDKGISGCTNAINLYLPNGIIKKELSSPETVIEFTPAEIGEIKFSCWMKMVWGKFEVGD